MKGVIRRKSKVKYKSFEPADCRICAIKKRVYPCCNNSWQNLQFLNVTNFIGIKMEIDLVRIPVDQVKIII